MRATVLLLALTVLLGAQPARAQDAGRAALVVVRGDGTVERRCVAFEGESATGYELLARAGFDVTSEQVAMGASVCALDGEGCAFPREACFCQCQGRTCTYWSYWQQDESGAWQYSGAGAGSRRVHDGAVDGWVWGPGSVAEAPAPPPATFAEICPAAVASAAPMAPVSEAAAPTGSVPPAVTGAMTVTQADAPAAEAPAAGGVQWGGLLLAALPLPLLVFGYLIWRRRQ